MVKPCINLTEHGRINLSERYSGEEGPRIQGVKCLLSIDFIIVLSILSTSAILEGMSAAALLICNVK